MRNNYVSNETEPESESDFEKRIKTGEIDPYPYDRLMIIYRKTKQYRKELRIIKRGIQVFEQHLKRQQQQALKGYSKSSQIKLLSERIRNQTGLSDRKGNDIYIPEPVARWLKRKAVVENKLKALK